MCKLIKKWWSKLWSKTTIDEKAIAKAKEIKCGAWLTADNILSCEWTFISNILQPT